ncbi:MAG: histidine phosphatase family protein [Bacteroidales bacterium]|nr:MAG: histidine phosphatase family protein [Bacteroidales bacterium]
MEYKELIVIRHAKSSWDEPNTDDADRALISRGIADAYAMANRQKKILKSIDLVLTSHANRATHTATIFAGIIGYPYEKIKLSSKLYEISEHQLISIVKSLPNDLSRVIIVGHNPTFTYFVNKYLKSPIDNIPTAGMVGLSFHTDSWSDISKDNLQSSFFEYPKKEQL